MTYDPNNPNDINRRRAAGGLGTSTWVGIVIVLAIIVLGAIYWAGQGNKSAVTANNPPATTSETTGSAPSGK
jgi:hypothetical protein